MGDFKKKNFYKFFFFFFLGGGGFAVDIFLALNKRMPNFKSKNLWNTQL